MSEREYHTCIHCGHDYLVHLTGLPQIAGNEPTTRCFPSNEKCYCPEYERKANPAGLAPLGAAGGVLLAGLIAANVGAAPAAITAIVILGLVLFVIGAALRW